MKQEVTIKNIEDLDRAAKEFLEKIGDNTIVAFFAPMGSGKTTFTTAICRVLGVTDPVGSPTFAIVNEYMRADTSGFGSILCLNNLSGKLHGGSVLAVLGDFLLALDVGAAAAALRFLTVLLTHGSGLCL